MLMPLFAGDMSVSSSDDEDEDDAPALKFIDAGDEDDNDMDDEEDEEDVMAAFRANQELELKKAKHTMTQTKGENICLETNQTNRVSDHDFYSVESAFGAANQDARRSFPHQFAAIARGRG